MNISMGSQRFVDVAIPLLWGKRAILQTPDGKLSVIDLGGEKARLEILSDKPAPGAEFRPRVDGVAIVHDGRELYVYNASEKQLIPLGLDLPPCQVTRRAIRVGSSEFSGNLISGSGVGIAVDANGFSMGGPLPPGLAKLTVG